MNTLKKVLIICTGNSCRSQIAEAIINAHLYNSWQAFSAGTKPAGYVHPKALVVLTEIGIHHTGISKSIDEFKNVYFDVVISVCDSAAEECPTWLGNGKHIHYSFPDPAITDDLNDFRAVRDDIEKTILNILNSDEK